MGFCFFTENTTLNIHSLGLNVGQLVHVICIGGGGGGGGGSGLGNLYYQNSVDAANRPATNANGGVGGTGGITSFGSFVSARGGTGGGSGKCYGSTYIAKSAGTGGTSYIENSAGGSGYLGTGTAQNYQTSDDQYYQSYQTTGGGGGGGGAGEYVYKLCVLNNTTVPITIGAPGAAGTAGIGYNYNFYYWSTNNTYTNGTKTNGGAGGAAGRGGQSASSATGGGGGSGFGAGGGGGAGPSAGGGGGAGGYFIGEQRIYNKAGVTASSTTGGQSGFSLDFSTLYPRVGAGGSGRTYPVLNKAGSGLVVLMW